MASHSSKRPNVLMHESTEIAWPYMNCKSYFYFLDPFFWSFNLFLYVKHFKKGKIKLSLHNNNTTKYDSKNKQSVYNNSAISISVFFLIPGSVYSKILYTSWNSMPLPLIYHKCVVIYSLILLYLSNESQSTLKFTQC